MSPSSVRIGTRYEDEFAKLLGTKGESMRTLFGQIMVKCTQTSETSVMMGDSVVKKDTTFDPTRVHKALETITSGLDGWDIQNVTTTSNEDKRRLFTKFSITESGTKLSGHLSLQYHVLLYYAPDQRVLECQKELASLIDDTGGSEEKRAELADKITRSKLESLGHTNPTEQEMFEILYNNESLRKEISAEIDARTDPKELSLSEKKAALYVELDKHLLEVYQTSHVLIDEARLVGGEEGYVFTLDIESKDGTFDSQAIPEEVRTAILSRMSQLEGALGRA